MVERLAQRGSAAQRITVELELEDCPTAIAVRELDTPTSQVEVPRSATGHLLAGAEVPGRVEVLTLVAGDLTPMLGAQLDLFGESSTTPEAHQHTLRRLMTRFGRQRFLRAVPSQHHAPLTEYRFHLEDLLPL